MPALTQFYTLSLHDALPISDANRLERPRRRIDPRVSLPGNRAPHHVGETAGGLDASRATRLDERPRDAPRVPLFAVLVNRSEEHTSELQSLRHLVCRLLLEK